jgi:hypothetical protein
LCKQNSILHVFYSVTYYFSDLEHTYIILVNQMIIGLHYLKAVNSKLLYISKQLNRWQLPDKMIIKSVKIYGVNLDIVLQIGKSIR